MPLSFVPHQGSSTKEYIAYQFAAILSTNSCDKISVETIVKECGISRTTFYRYFEDKYALLLYIYTEEIDHLLKDKSANFESYRITIEFMYRERKLFRNILLNDRRNALKTFIFQRSAEDLTASVKKGLQCEALPEEYIYAINYTCAGCINMWSDWIMKDCPVDADVFAKWMFDNTPEQIRKYCI